MELTPKSISMLVINAILLLLGGVVVNAFYDLLFKDLILWFANGVVHIYSFATKSYVDSIYAKIGMGANYAFGIRTYILVYFSIMMSICVLIEQLKIEKVVYSCPPKKAHEKDGKEKTSKSGRKATARNKVYSLIVIVFVTVTIQVMQEVHVANVAIYFENSIEILEPYLAEQEIKILKSKYRQINNSEALHSLNTELKALAKKHSIKLPEQTIY